MYDWLCRFLLNLSLVLLFEGDGGLLRFDEDDPNFTGDSQRFVPDVEHPNNLVGLPRGLGESTAQYSANFQIAGIPA